MHLTDAFIQSDLQIADAMLYHWATQEHAGFWTECW